VSRTIQIHYPVVVEMVLDDDNTILSTGTPYIDADVSVGYDGQDVWDVTNEVWVGRADETEWDAGAHLIGLAVDHSKALDQIHAILDGVMWDADTLDAIVAILTKNGYEIREPADR
jgi:hypothetical protein